MPPINPDEAPEAPQPSPRLELFMYISENDAADNYDGGRVVMKPVRAGLETLVMQPGTAPVPVIIDAGLVISARTDEFLMRFPWKTRTAKATRFYRILVEEVAESDLPPDPEQVAEAAALKQRLAELERTTR